MKVKITKPTASILAGDPEDEKKLKAAQDQLEEVYDHGDPA